MCARFDVESATRMHCSCNQPLAAVIATANDALAINRRYGRNRLEVFWRNEWHIFCSGMQNGLKAHARRPDGVQVF